MAHDRKFRFGVMAPSATSAAEFARRRARPRISGTRRSTCPTTSSTTRSRRFPAMAMAAAATTTLRVGSLVLGNDYKHPVVARAARPRRSTCLSDGRLELGHRRRLDDRRLREGRHPARPARRAHRPPRRVDRGPQGSHRPTGRSRSAASTTRSPTSTGAEAGAAAAPADRHRRRRQEGAGARGARGRHRRHQRQPAQRHAGDPDTAPIDEPGEHRREARSGCAPPPATGSTTSRSRRSPASCTSPTTRQAIADGDGAGVRRRRPRRCSTRRSVSSARSRR